MIKNILRLLTYSFLWFGLIGTGYAQNKEDKLPNIPIIGKTSDGKYPIYKLKGGLSHFKYTSGKHTFQLKQLDGRMKYIKEEDVNAGIYTCEYICQDKKGRTVGLNPEKKH